MGEPKLTGKLLYHWMIEKADGMLAVMKEDRYDDVIHDVVRFTGADPWGRPFWSLVLADLSGLVKGRLLSRRLLKSSLFQDSDAHYLD